MNKIAYKNNNKSINNKKTFFDKSNKYTNVYVLKS